MMSEAPCKNCITYPICKSQLYEEVEFQVRLTHQFPNDICFMDHIVYEAFTRTLQQKCTLICAYMGGQPNLGIYSFKPLTIAVLYDHFKNSMWEEHRLYWEKAQKELISTKAYDDRLYRSI